jgi:hypothetical protein
MGRTPDKISRPQWERELLAEASRLNVLGLDPLATLRRVRQEHEKPSPPESDDRAEAILSALAWLSTPEAKRTVRAPELTSLSDVEAEAIHAAIVAVEAGVPVAQIVSCALAVEERFQSPVARASGRVVPDGDLPTMLEILEREPFALFSHRILRAFMRWLPDASTKSRNRALRLLSVPPHPCPGCNRGEGLDYLATSVYLSVSALRHEGLSRRDAERAVARGVRPSRILLRVPKGEYQQRDARRGRLPRPWFSARESLPLRWRQVGAVESTLPCLERDRQESLAATRATPDSLERAIREALRDAITVAEAIPFECGDVERAHAVGCAQAAAGDKVGTVSLYRKHIEPIPRMQISRVQSLLRRAEHNMGLPPRVHPHRRPRRSKAETT